jgi:hypothetical protein
MTILSWLSVKPIMCRMMPQSFARCKKECVYYRRKKKAAPVGGAAFSFHGVRRAKESSGWNQGCQCKKQSESGDDECGTANLSCVSLFGLPANAGEVPIYGSPADLIHKGDRHGCLPIFCSFMCINALGISL